MTPTAAGPGMVLRVDVVAAALDAVYGGVPEHRVVALTPQGRQLDQATVEELAVEERLTLLSSRFEGFDERIVIHLASDAISIGPYVLSGGELPAMVMRRRDRAPAARARSGARSRGSLRASRPRSRAASSIRTTRGRPSSVAGASPKCSSRATTPASSSGGGSRA